jgi:hypothetical protein
MVKPFLTVGRMALGPRCARKAGLLERKPRKVSVEVARFADPRQIDWVEVVAVAPEA